jgi:hypothetical protein
LRDYEPIWTKLKAMPFSEASTKGVSVTANRALHRRIIKAVQKEKYMDVAYKIHMEPIKTILWYRKKDALITFYLKIAVGSINLIDHRHL